MKIHYEEDVIAFLRESGHLIIFKDSVNSGLPKIRAGRTVEGHWPFSDHFIYARRVQTVGDFVRVLLSWRRWAPCNSFTEDITQLAWRKERAGIVINQLAEAFPSLTDMKLHGHAHLKLDLITKQYEKSGECPKESENGV